MSNANEKMVIRRTSGLSIEGVKADFTKVQLPPKITSVRMQELLADGTYVKIEIRPVSLESAHAALHRAIDVYISNIHRDRVQRAGCDPALSMVFAAPDIYAELKIIGGADVSLKHNNEGYEHIEYAPDHFNVRGTLDVYETIGLPKGGIVVTG